MKMPLWGRVCLCIAILVSMEVPISRLHYQARIRNEVTPRKLELMDKHADLLDCTASLTADGVLKVEQPSCQDFCETTLELSGMRQRILDDVRQSSVASRVLAEVFDRQRGTSQDSKVAALYDRKTCAGVIAGVDRTNSFVNIFNTCWLVVGLQVILFATSTAIFSHPAWAA